MFIISALHNSSLSPSSQPISPSCPKFRTSEITPLPADLLSHRAFSAVIPDSRRSCGAKIDLHPCVIGSAKQPLGYYSASLLSCCRCVMAAETLLSKGKRLFVLCFELERDSVHTCFADYLHGLESARCFFFFFYSFAHNNQPSSAHTLGETWSHVSVGWWNSTAINRRRSSFKFLIQQNPTCWSGGAAARLCYSLLITSGRNASMLATNIQIQFSNLSSTSGSLWFI